MVIANDPILKTRILALQSDLDRISLKNIRNLGIEQQSQGSKDYNTCGFLKDKTLEEYEISIAGNLINKVNRMGSDLDKISSDNQWKEFDQYNEKSREFFHNWVELVGGFLIRDWGLDYAICNIADTMIRKYANRTGKPWIGVTIPSHDKMLRETLLRIIRLPFQQWTIWTLPLVAHEYAHVLASENEDDPHSYKPIRQLIHDINKDAEKKIELIGLTKEEAKTYIEELFSDIYATYVVGPAYACTAIYLTLNPLFKECLRPNGSERAIVILETLRNMNSTANEYEKVIDTLEKSWNNTVTHANSNGDKNRMQLDFLRGISDKIYKFLEDDNLGFNNYSTNRGQHSTGQTNGWDRVIKLKDYFNGRIEGKNVHFSNSAIKSDQLCDVLNAAWICRLEHEDEAKEIKKYSLEICIQAIERDLKPKPHTKSLLSNELEKEP